MADMGVVDAVKETLRRVEFFGPRWIRPTVTKAPNGYLAVSPEGSDLRIGILGRTRDEAERKFRTAEERWRRILG